MEYTNSQIRELIAEHIHNQIDRKMVFERLVNGMTFEKISEIYQLDVKTVRKRIHKCEDIIFRHIPG
jgi:DNA-directed RNA polymerase specialized sigma24 family protein